MTEPTSLWFVLLKFFLKALNQIFLPFLSPTQISSRCLQWVDICWVLRLEHAIRVQGPTHLLPLPEAVQREDYWRYISAGSTAACCGWIHSSRWGRRVCVREAFFLHPFREKEIFVFIGQLTDPKHRLTDIEQQHQYQLFLLFWSCGYKNCLGNAVRRVASWRQSSGQKRRKNAGLYCKLSLSEGWLCPGNYERAASTKFCFTPIFWVWPRLGTRRSGPALRYKAGQGAVDLSWVYETNLSGDCRFFPNPLKYIFCEGVTRTLNYSHTSVEQYGMQFLEAKTDQIVQDLISPSLLQGMPALTYRRSLHVGKVMLGHPHLLHAVKQLNKGSPSSQRLEAAALDDVLFLEYDGRPHCLSSVLLMHPCTTKMGCLTPDRISVLICYSIR